MLNSVIDISSPRTVQVTFEFTRIGEIDTINEKFNAEIYIESKWIETENIQSYDPEKNWNPQIYIENTLQEPKEKVKYSLKKKCQLINNLNFEKSII